MARYTIILLGLCLFHFTAQPADSNSVPSNYWFAGYMYINSSNPDLTYRTYTWVNQYNKMDYWGPILSTNSTLNIKDLMNGIDNCVYMWWGQLTDGSYAGTKLLLVPQAAPDITSDQQAQQQFQRDLVAGRIAPYIVVERDSNAINIYIIGPLFPSGNIPLCRKFSLNFLAFEQTWIKNSPWYNSLAVDLGPAKVTIPPLGMAFAFSFDADTGSFISVQNEDSQDTSGLANGSFYICGLKDKNSQLGWSWTYQGAQNTAMSGMTIKKLREQGIVQYLGSGIPLNDLQRIINFINSTGQGNFQSVL